MANTHGRGAPGPQLHHEARDTMTHSRAVSLLSLECCGTHKRLLPLVLVRNAERPYLILYSVACHATWHPGILPHDVGKQSKTDATPQHRIPQPVQHVSEMSRTCARSYSLTGVGSPLRRLHNSSTSIRRHSTRLRI